MSCKKVNIYCEDDGYGVIVSTKFDKRNGEYLQYHYNDGYKIEKIFNYINGICHGKSCSFYKTGNIEGGFISYYENGNICEKYYYIMDMINGEYIEYNKNGDLVNKCYYIDNLIIDERPKSQQQYLVNTKKTKR